MSYGSAHLVQVMLDAMRYLMWVVVSGLAVVGAAFYGGAGVAAVWQKAGPPARRRNDAVSREAAEGLAEIEAFLAARSPDPDRTDIPPVERRNLPPASDEAA